jgi:predicted dehydrogenase
MADANHARARPVAVLMVAIGGYGYHYLKALLDEVPAGRAQLAGVVDPFASASAAWPRVSASEVPVADTVEAFFGAGHRAELTVVASPIHFHVAQSVTALVQGSHVLCDKPIGATVREVEALVQARDRAARFVMIGYQWSFSSAIQALKHDVLAGRYGRPLRFATLCAWPRDMAYYRRNTWAGRLRDGETAAWVLDSPANNAMAHFLHNAFFLLGPEMHLSAMPVSVTAELARAYPIDSADTAACRAVTDNECDVLFLASHVTEGAVEPRFRLECEDAVVTFGETSRRIVARNASGEIADYGNPDDTPQFQKLLVAIERARHPGHVVCGVEAAAAQTVCVGAMHDSAADIVTFPTASIRHAGEHVASVTGLGDDLLRCYASSALPSEIGCAWARPGRPVRPGALALVSGGRSAETAPEGAAS